MYGIGNRLDASPELLFELRAVDHMELIERALPVAPIGAKSSAPKIHADDLGDIFGIEIGDVSMTKEETKTRKQRGGTQVVKPKTSKERILPANKKKTATNVRKKG